MIATKLTCPICGKEYLAKMDDAWQDFAPHCQIQLPAMWHYIREARLFNGEDAETFRLSVEDFIGDVHKLLMALSEIESEKVTEVMNRYGVRL